MSEKEVTKPTIPSESSSTLVPSSSSSSSSSSTSSEKPPHERKSDFIVKKKSKTQLSRKKASADSQRFYRDVRRAFQVVAAQLVGVTFLYVLYNVYLMMEEQIVPLLWALFVSILLKAPKEAIISFLSPLEAIEKAGRGRIGKAQYLAKEILIHPIVASLIAISVAAQLGCWIFGMFCSFPSFWILTFIFFLSGIFILVFSIPHSSSHSSFVSTFLVFGLLFSVLFFMIFFVFQAVNETVNFGLSIKNLVEAKLNDPSWAKLLEDYGITSESINHYTTIAQHRALEWIEEQGYNVTEIQEMVSTYSSSNSTQLASDLWSNFDYQAVKKSIEDKIDLSSLSNTLSGVGEIAFGTGAGFLNILSSIVGPIFGAINNLFDLFFFVGATLYLVDAEYSFVEMIFQILPVTKTHQKEISNTLTHHLSQVFLCAILLSVSHGFATWLYFSLCGMNFAYSAGFIVGITTIFPLLSPWLVFIPALCITYLQGSSFTVFYGVGLILTEYALGQLVDDKIFELIPGSQPYVTGLSIAFGVSTFGISGLLIGPMLIVLLKSLFSLFTINLAATKEEANDESIPSTPVPQQD